MTTNTVLPLASRVHSAGITLTLAQASFDIWWRYKNVATRETDTMNRYPNFFAYDEEAHFRNLVVTLYTLYDNHKGTVTIRSLISELDPQAAKPIWRKYRAVHDGVRKLTKLRHNVFAHRNAFTSYSEIFRNTQITPDDLAKVVADSFELVGMVCVTLGLETPLCNTHVSRDTAAIIKKLKNG